MNKQLTISQSSLKCVRVIYNDDVQVVDFLSDLMDREPIHALQKYVDFADRQPICLLHDCKMDEIVILIVYKAPFGMNDEQNRLTLFANNDLKGLCRYFNRWNGIVDKSNKELSKSIDEITRLLYFQWTEEQEKNTQTNHLG